MEATNKLKDYSNKAGNYYKSSVAPFVSENRVLFSILGGVAAGIALAALLKSGRAKDLISRAGSTAGDYANKLNSSASNFADSVKSSVSHIVDQVKDQTVSDNLKEAVSKKAKKTKDSVLES